jgi:hypothetical protein
MTRNRHGVVEEIAATKLQVAGDVRHLREIWRGLSRTQQVIESGLAAFQNSRHLLLRVENTPADQHANSDV